MSTALSLGAETMEHKTSEIGKVFASSNKYMFVKLSCLACKIIVYTYNVELLCFALSSTLILVYVML